ncbi:MAG TPA: pilin [Candidatus Paceibacterota bacterium]|nr:pilin [Candidatus Paceibacterota bacterium]
MRKHLIFLAAFALLVPFFAFAANESQGFVSLTNIDAIKFVGNQNTLPDFLNSVYRVCIGIAAILAVLQIMRAGIMYMGGDSITEKKEARKIIGMSIAGLVLVLSPTIVFGIINPEILNLQIGRLNELNTAGSSSSEYGSTTPMADTACSVFTGGKAAGPIPNGETCSTQILEGSEPISNSCCENLQAGYICCGKR